MAGAIEGHLVGALPGMIRCAIGAGVLRGAKAYTAVVESGYYGAMGALECTTASVSAACSIWKKGVTGNVKAIAKERYGINDFQKAKEELGRSVVNVESKSVIRVDGKDVVKVETQEVRNPLSDRIGVAAAHSVKGITKIAASNAILGVSAAYAVGAISNVAEVTATTGSMLHGAQLTATGLNMVAGVSYGVTSLLATPASMVASAGFSVLSSGVSLAWNNPKVVLAGALLYGAAKEVVNASEATGTIRKVAHGSMAFFATAAAISIPVLTYTMGA